MGAKRDELANDIIKSCDRIRIHLIKRFTTLNLSNKEICRDARVLGFKIDESQLSRYMNKKNMKRVNALSQQQIIWLCIRYDIGIRIMLGHYDKKGHDYFRARDRVFDNERSMANLKQYGFKPEETIQITEFDEMDLSNSNKMGLIFNPDGKQIN